MRLAAAFLLLAGFTAAGAATRESWNGSYQCGPTIGGSGGSAYTSRITMLIENGEAHITRESAAIKESMRGRVAADGTVRLEGTGARKEGGTGWLYRFDGRIDGNRFDARGAMISPYLTSRLRECSMSLTRVRSAPGAQAPETSVKLKSSRDTASGTVNVVATSAPAPTAAPTAKPRSAAGESLERELDFGGKSDTATMEGTVTRGVPHRYVLSAKRGQTVRATLKSDGARFDLYEPGSTLTLLSGGFIVQGARLGATEDGKGVDVDLPADGKYLLLVRANGDQAFYGLDIKVERAPSTAFQTWMRNEWVWIGAAILVVVALFAFTRRKRDRRLFKSS